MRPLYETENDRALEARVISRLEVRWKCRAVKLPISYKVDFALEREKVKAWVEVKCRGRKYEEMYLSLHKWMAGRELSLNTGLPFILVYGFKDEIYWRSVSKDAPSILIGGRQDRGDWQDLEPMAVFGLDTFKRLP